MLESAPLLLAGRAGQRLEPRVYLQRIGRYGHRFLAKLAQALGERDRDVRLAHAGRPEQGDDLGSWHWLQYRASQ